jgi:hypothetical protein
VNYAKLLEMNFFFTLHSFLEVGKHKICQVNFGKLLEMLLAGFWQNKPTSQKTCMIRGKVFHFRRVSLAD